MSKDKVAAINKKLNALFDKGIPAQPKIVIVIKDSKQVEKSGKNAAYEELNIECKNGTTSWNIKKKLADFADLNSVLKKQLKVPDVPPLPKRGGSIFGSKKPKDLKKQLRLQEFMAYLANTRVIKFKQVQDFLEAPEDLRETVNSIWEALETPIYEGWVEKLGGTYKSWKKRWARSCADYTIKYFEDEKMETLKGTVDLREVEQSRQDHSDKAHQFILELRTKARVWKFNCGNQKELDKFFDTIQLLREDEHGWQAWLPDDGGKGRSFTIAGGPLDDERKVDDMEVIDEEGEVDEELIRLRDQNKEIETEIKSLEDNLEHADGKTADIKTLLIKTQQSIDEMKKTRTRAEEELQKMKKTSEEIKVASNNKVNEIQNQTASILRLVEGYQKENTAFENQLKKLKLRPIPISDASGGDDLDNFILEKPVLSGKLLKFGKAGKKKPKTKHVVFASLKEGFFIEWADILRENQAVTRMQLLGWSMDPKLIDSKRLTQDELNRVFIVQGLDRLAVFMADSKDSRDQWINGFQRCRLTELASDYL